jgi:hypothetical protein
MICIVYIITGFKGMCCITRMITQVLAVCLTGTVFWDTPFLTATGLKQIPLIAEIVPNVPLNIVFMYLGAIGLFFNILTRFVKNFDICNFVLMNT